MEDLSLHILDIVQNSVSAMADTVSLSVTEDHQNDRLIIAVDDNGRGMDQETARKVLDPFYTTRTTRKVGLGLPLLSAVAEACDGFLAIDSQPGKGARVEAQFSLGHIDRPPLGNITDTMITLIVCNPDVDFIYEHMTPSGKFVFDTRQIRDEIPDIPLGNPDVLAWIRAYLLEGLDEIHGGGLG